MYIGIKKILEKKEKSIYWLAKEIDMKHIALTRLCNCKTKSISFDTMEKICEALECTPNDIFILGEREK